MKKHTILIFIALLLTALSPGHAGGLLFVGNSGACTYGSIQAAIDDATPNSEIRVTNEINAGTLFENLSITKNLVVKGGYTNCGLAQLDSRADENRTVVDGTDSGNVIRIDGDGLHVELSGFTLTGGIDQGIGPGRAQGGAVSIRGDDNDITFEHMTISDNHGRLGGGIYLSGESDTVYILNSIIIDNSGSSGGGIYCTSPGVDNIVNYLSLSVVGNQATGISEITGHGGGFYLSQCKLAQIGANGRFSITHNQANNSGGGIYMVNTVNTLLRGTLWSNLANADLNDTGDGGGVFASSVNQLVVDNTYLIENQVSDGNGGGIYALNSSLQVQDSGYNTCIQSDTFNCLRFQGNRATPELGGSPTFGGAMYLGDNSSLMTSADVGNSLDHSPGFFEDNHADFGSALSMNDSSTFSMQNAYFVGNGSNGSSNTIDNSLFWLTDTGTELQVSFSTMAQNQVSNVFNVQNDASLDLINSIVYEDSAMNQVVLNNLAAVFIRCNIYHEGGSVSILPSDPSIVTDDPGFIDPANDNYHLRPDSVAIDRCTQGTLDVVYPDRDIDGRPIDIPDVSNGIGSYDAGADEYNDLIYKNGFESFFSF